MQLIHFSKTARVALAAAALALIPVSVFAETITGTKNITTDVTPDFYQVGNATTPGYLNINGGNVTFTGQSEKLAFRDQYASLLVVNGTVTIANSTVKTSANGAIFADAPAGCSANIILNSGANVTSEKYPTLGSALGTTGSLTVNDGATFTTKSALYVGGWGHGTVTLNKGGTINLVGSGLQIGRDYAPGYGDCEGVMNMTGGSLTVDKYLIMGLINPKDTHVNTAVMNVTGGKVTVGQYTCVAANNQGVSHERINAVLSLGGGAETATMWVAGNFQVGCGENAADWAKPTDGTLNVYKNGILKTGVDVATGAVAQATSFNVGSTSSLNVDGGQMTVCGTSGLLNEGTINVKSGTLTVDKAVSNRVVTNGTTVGEIKVTGGTFNAGSVTNAGTITITPSLDGWGKMAITGAYSSTGNGKISVGLDHGLGLFSTLCGTVNEVLTAASGLNAVTNSALFTVTKTDSKISAKANTEAAVQMKLGDTLAVNSPLGMAKVTGFEGNSAITFDVKNGDKALTAQETSALVDWLNESDVLGDALTVSGAEGLITLSGLSGIKDGSYFAFDLGSYNAAYKVGTIGSAAVPEPATWALLLLGLGALAVVRGKR